MCPLNRGKVIIGSLKNTADGPLRSLLEELKMKHSLIQVNSAVHSLGFAMPHDKGEVSQKPYEDAMKQVEFLRQTVVQELRERLFYFVEPKREAFYVGGSFSQDIKDAFPFSIYDMEAAGKCLALGRGTACVFHLMRVFEVGFRDMQGRYQIATPSNASWEQWKNKVYSVNSCV